MRDLDQRLAELKRRLRARLRDHEAWREVARIAGRRGVPPEFLEWRRHRAAIRSAMRAHPGEPGFRMLVLAVLGLEAIRPTGGPGGYWSGKRRPRRGKGWVVDPKEGMPLAVRHRGTGQELRWIPRRKVRLGWLREFRWSGRRVGTPTKAGGGYLGRYPVTVGVYAAFLATRPEPGPLEPEAWARQRDDDPRRPVGGLSRDQAAALQAWAGGALPGQFDWEFAARGDDLRPYPWGEKPEPGQAIPEAWWRELTRAMDGVGPGDWPEEPLPPPIGGSPKGTSPLGIEEMAGHLAEYCGDTACVRGGVFFRGRLPRDPTSTRQAGHPWRTTLQDEEFTAHAAPVGWHRWSRGREYPGQATTRLWIPVDAPVHAPPADGDDD